jgi:hypothetical protein
MSRINLAGYVLLLFSACLLSSAKPAPPKDPVYNFYAMNNSGSGCIESITGIDGFSLSSPLCDGGSVETTFTSHDYYISGYVSGYSYFVVTLGGSNSGLIDSQIIYTYGYFAFDVSNHLNEGYSLTIYPLNP